MIIFIYVQLFITSLIKKAINKKLNKLMPNRYANFVLLSLTKNAKLISILIVVILFFLWGIWDSSTCLLCFFGLYERQWNAYNTNSNRVCFRFIWKCRLRHRGPDWSGLHCHGNCYLAHQRLAIVDPTSGDQPLYNEDKTVVVTVFSISIVFFFFLFNKSSDTRIFNKC